MGTYNPIPFKDDVKEISINTDRIKYWLAVGAQPSERVSWLLSVFGLLPQPPKRQFVESAVPKDQRKKEEPKK